MAMMPTEFHAQARFMKAQSFGSLMCTAWLSGAELNVIRRAIVAVLFERTVHLAWRRRCAGGETGPVSEFRHCSHAWRQ